MRKKNRYDGVSNFNPALSDIYCDDNINNIVDIDVDYNQINKDFSKIAPSYKKAVKSVITTIVEIATTLKMDLRKLVNVLNNKFEYEFVNFQNKHITSYIKNITQLVADIKNEIITKHGKSVNIELKEWDKYQISLIKEKTSASTNLKKHEKILQSLLTSIVFDGFNTDSWQSDIFCDEDIHCICRIPVITDVFDISLKDTIININKYIEELSKTNGFNSVNINTILEYYTNKCEIQYKQDIIGLYRAYLTEIYDFTSKLLKGGRNIKILLDRKQAEGVLPFYTDALDELTQNEDGQIKKMKDANSILEKQIKDTAFVFDGQRKSKRRSKRRTKSNRKLYIKHVRKSRSKSTKRKSRSKSTKRKSRSKSKRKLRSKSTKRKSRSKSTKRKSRK